MAQEDWRMRRYLAEVVLLVVSTHDVRETIRSLEKELTEDEVWGATLHGDTWIEGAVYFGVHPSKGDGEYRVSFYLTCDTNIDMVASLEQLMRELPEKLFGHRQRTIQVKSATANPAKQILLGKCCAAKQEEDIDHEMSICLHVECGFDWYHHDEADEVEEAE